MRHLFLSLFLILAFSVSAQNIKKKYSFSIHEEGSVHFIHSLKGFECKDLTINKKLDYDATYVSIRDSITLNCTFYNDTPADSVFIMTAEKQRTAVSYSTIFIQPYKKGWQHRLSLKMPATFFEDLYKNAKPYEFVFYAKNKVYTYTSNQKNWNESSAVVNKIFEVIKYTK